MNDFSKYALNASVLEVGGFKPSNDFLESFFGRVTVRHESEKWPTDSDGKDLIPLCQINFEQLGISLKDAKDTKMLVIYVGHPSRMGEKNGDGWLIRSYDNLKGLVETESTRKFDIKSFPIRFKENITDWPSFEDSNIEFPVNLENNYESNFPNHGGLKIGGWPSLIQGCQTMDGVFQFQIPSLSKCNWSWGDDGVAFFFLTDIGWKMEWQCF